MGTIKRGLALAMALAAMTAPGAHAQAPTVDAEGEACSANSGLMLYSSWTVGIEHIKLSTVGAPDGAWVCLETAAASVRVIVPGAAAAARYDDQHEACVANGGRMHHSSYIMEIGTIKVSSRVSATETWVCIESPLYDVRVILPVPDTGVRNDRQSGACVDNGGVILYSSWTVGIGDVRLSTWSDGSQAWVCFESFAVRQRVILPTGGTGARWDSASGACMANGGEVLYTDGSDRLSSASVGSERWVCYESPSGFHGRVVVPVPGS